MYGKSDYIKRSYSKTQGWTCTEARAWLKKHHFQPIKKVHKTSGNLRYRITEPTGSKYRIKHTDEGISFYFSMVII